MSLKKQGGFTYLGIMIAVIITGVLLAQAGVNWRQSAQREKERQLLFVGHQFRQAIASYYERTPGAIGHYPAKLEDLVEDHRYNPPQHYLRKIYIDPMTSRPEWGLVKAPQGGIMGIHSLSGKTPLKKAGFDQADSGFKKAKTYMDWKFSYDPVAVAAPAQMGR